MVVMLQRNLLRMLVAGFLFCGSGAWFVKMPSRIKGLRRSCLVIPCSYGYNNYPPTNPEHVVWYQYVKRGYPVVYDGGRGVIAKFSGKTSRVGTGSRDCSLQIYPLESSHHQERLYPWVDPEHVGSGTFKFYDTTVTIEVADTAERPVIEIYGERKLGQTVSVRCSVVHTCPTKPPILRIHIQGQSPQSNAISHESLSDGTTRTTLTTSLLIKDLHQTVECSVHHSGGLEARASESFQAECSVMPMSISPATDMFLEGQVSKVSCSVEYTCPKQVPTLSWNYGGTLDNSYTKNEVGRWRATSELMFAAEARHQGEPLTCSARFAGGRRDEKSMTIQVKRSLLFRGWSVTTPGTVTGVRGSCVVIPCSFTYTTSQPPDLKVAWYLIGSEVDQPAADRYSQRSSTLGNVAEGNCTLLIEKLEKSDHQNMFYPWMDKDPITAYHGHNFNDKASRLIVTDSAQQPHVTMNSIPRVGEESKVSCSVRHSCPTAPPTLTLRLSPGDDRLSHTEVSHGVWQTTIERTWRVREEDEKVTCDVRWPDGGQTATTDFSVKVECPFEDIQMEGLSGQLMEGMAMNVTCSVSHHCKKAAPSITWNYGDMQSSTLTQPKASNNMYRTVSSFTFFPSLKDNGKALTCTAQFSPEGRSLASTTLRVQKYRHRVVTLKGIDSASQVMAADVPHQITALARSCVVIPCSFQTQAELKTRLKAIWYDLDGHRVYSGGQSQVRDHFKKRTKLLGDVSQRNCTLEIDDIKPFDNGPFCFRAEKGEGNKYSFTNSCVFIMMQASPERPLMTSVPKEVGAGSVVDVTCSVNHTCSSHPPTLNWSNQTTSIVVRHTCMGQGIWETSSTVTLVPEAGDGPKALSCTAIFWRGKRQITTVQLTVKGTLMFQLRNSMPVSIPSAVVALVVLLAAVAGILLWRKRKRHSENWRAVWSNM